MVSGKILNVVHCGESTWVQVEDTIPYSSQCSIRVERNEAIKPGDFLCWQLRTAYWTPRYGDREIPLERVGYAHTTIPEDVMEKVEELAFA